MLSYVDSTFIFTDNLPRLLTFYRDTLGLPVLHQAPTYALLGFGSGSMLGLGTHSQIRGPAHEPQRFMINFYCEDVQSAAGELTRRGVKFLIEPYEEEGSTIAAFADPDGNRLQLINYTLG